MNSSCELEEDIVELTIRDDARRMTTDMNDEEVIAQVTDNLSARNSDIPRSIIDDVVREEFTALAGRPVRDYVSVLTERAAKKRLKKLTKAIA